MDENVKIIEPNEKMLEILLEIVRQNQKIIEVFCNPMIQIEKENK